MRLVASHARGCLTRATRESWRGDRRHHRRPPTTTSWRRRTGWNGLVRAVRRSAGDGGDRQRPPRGASAASQRLFEAYGGDWAAGLTRSGPISEWFWRPRRRADLEPRRDGQRGVPRVDLPRSADRRARRGARRGHADRLQRGYVLFYRILTAGHVIAYEPTRTCGTVTAADMRRCAARSTRYSKGHVAYHLTTLVRDGDRRALVRLVRASLPARLRSSACGRRSDYPLTLVLTEVAGTLAGLALWRRRRVRGWAGRASAA